MKPLALVIALAVAVPAAAQSFQWLPGLDLIVPVYTTTDEKGVHGPVDALLGYDRDTGRASLLRSGATCHEPWSWHPTAGKGGITHIIQIDAQTFALYHESGFIRLEPRPAVFVCTPL